MRWAWQHMSAILWSIDRVKHLLVYVKSIITKQEESMKRHGEQIIQVCYSTYIAIGGASRVLHRWAPRLLPRNICWPQTLLTLGYQKSISALMFILWVSKELEISSRSITQPPGLSPAQCQSTAASALVALAHVPSPTEAIPKINQQ